ncbi:PREDICTED: uncharacterized protein LOC109581970 isoform X2 [Amphimedon queenslandica]|uniref:RGS domain-containing protein n=1 Tax=Amphimedon queenslandica TaxID=400682 RepID=A0AAN0J4X3_AMPQE|nr:PREDICTED: uncharacterized protein LOC109581970 isoform X2 [Amphimedon queenslandica]|eukprot:XP_019852065.1 PREDICTED: uncharacterized protein LOC109581970 isoform X2 [Amphimedon queenslandica]
MASLALSPGHYNPKDKQQQQRRSATLSRLLATASVHPPSSKMAGGSSEASFRETLREAEKEQLDFTRVRRIQTLRYVAKEQRPTRSRAKSKSLHGSYQGKNRHPLKTYSKEEGNMPQPEKEDETEIQEISMQLRASFSSGSSSSCDNSQGEEEGEEGKEETEKEQTPISLCSKCQGFINRKDDAFILFGEDKLHLDCFKCGQCSQPVGSMEMFLVNVHGQPLCLVCTPSCHTCRNKILQNHVSVLKKDFHEDCLACSQCKQKFSLLTKVYASQGEPCCSKCISPVFSEKWSPLRFRSTSLPPVTSKLVTTDPPYSPVSQENGRANDSGVSEATSNDGMAATDEATPPPAHHQLIVSAAAKPPVEVVTLNPKLESLTRSITLYSSASQPAIRPSYSEPNLNHDPSNVLSSLRSLLFDENGVTLFVNYCVANDIIEYIVFWLDVEHFKHFDGSNEDLKIFAHHIVTKYIGYYAEVPVPLPRDIQRDIFNKIESTPSQELFNDAQLHVYTQMEREFLSGFLKSQDGENYLKMLADRELHKLKQLCSSDEDLSGASLHATITNFDKRRLDTKFYIYEVEVQRGSNKYHIYRR